MPKTVKLSLVALIIIVIGCLFASPYWVLNNIKNAAEENQSEKLSSYIDYPSVRESLKSQLQTRIDAEIKNQAQGKYAQFGAMFAASMADTLVDSLVSPEAVSLIFKGKAITQMDSKNQSANDAQAASISNQNPVTEKSKSNYSARYKSLNRFVVNIENPKKANSHVEIVLKRDGLSWKVAEIMIPMDR